jgi:riboflavin synthase
MFTGIIEHLAQVKQLKREGGNLHITFTSPVTHELKIDQSVAHNGVCLTVVQIEDNAYRVTAIAETLQRTNLSQLAVGDMVNLERCMAANGRFDGHIVQGHVDLTAICHEVKETDGSWYFSFTYTPAEQHHVTVEKGSVCINGVSLTVVESKEGFFSVAIIPYTFEHTNFKQLKAGDAVNIEFDVIGKYVARMLQQAGRI